MSENDAPDDNVEHTTRQVGLETIHPFQFFTVYHICLSEIINITIFVFSATK